jgi:hypothetical protein
MKDILLEFYEDYIKDRVTKPVVLFVLGALNLILAESFAGISLGIILLLVAYGDAMEGK